MSTATIYQEGPRPYADPPSLAWSVLNLDGIDTSQKGAVKVLKASVTLEEAETVLRPYELIVAWLCDRAVLKVSDRPLAGSFPPSMGND